MGMRKGHGTVTHWDCILQYPGSLTVIQRLPAEEAQAVEVEDGQPKQEILVEEEQDHASDAGIGPAAVHQQQRLKILELGDAEVAAHDCLHAFLSTDTHTCIQSWKMHQLQACCCA